MFRDDAQTNRAICAMLRAGSVIGYWTDSGPTDRGVAALKSSSLSRGGALLIRVAFDLFNRKGKADLGSMLNAFDRRNMRNVLTLVLAAEEGPEAVDRWIAALEDETR